MPNLRAAPKTHDTVQVVDDDPKIADLVRMYLEHAGLDVAVAAAKDYANRSVSG